MSAKVRRGDTVAPRELPTIAGPHVPLPDSGRVVHLQFRRYASCPICNLHLREFGRRHDEIGAAGIREVVVFHSTAEQLRVFQSELPFDVVPDPARALYRAFGVERSVRALVHPRSWVAAVRGWRPSLGIRAGNGGHFGMPADFLVAQDGDVLAAHYGAHAYDQWTVDEVLALAGSRRDE